MKRFKKSAFILAALLVVQSIGIAPLRMTTKAAENDTNAIIEEDFSDYFGGAPEGVSNTGIKALSGQYSDFQGNSLRWQNPEDGSAQIANQLVDGITYTLDKPLENGKYVLSPLLVGWTIILRNRLILSVCLKTPPPAFLCVALTAAAKVEEALSAKADKWVTTRVWGGGRLPMPQDLPTRRTSGIT